MGDYADDAWDPGDSYSWTPREGWPRDFKRLPRICNLCGTGGLYWIQNDDLEWKLHVIKTKELHRCEFGFKSRLAKLRC